jgi:hypothetical protein
LTADTTHTDVQFDVPIHAETGTWTMSMVLKDQTGNAITLTSADLATRGFDTNVTFTGTGDTTKPTLVDAQMTTPNTFSTENNPGSTDVMVNYNATDNYPGWTATGSGLTFTSPSGNVSYTNQLSPNGPDTQVIVSIPQFSEGGVWTPSFTLVDAVGNTKVYTNSDLLAIGIDLRFTITGTTDTAGPTVQSLNIGLATPVIDDMPFAGAEISFNAVFTDNLSGVGSLTRLNYTSASGSQHATAYFNENTGVPGVFQGLLDLPAYSEAGTWTPTLITEDNAGATRTYTQAQLDSLGMKIAFTVTKRVVAHLLPGNTLSSDEENNGTTASDGVEATVSSPVEGDASISIIQSDIR